MALDPVLASSGPTMWGLRAYLLGGLVAHKALWEVLRRRSVAPRASGSPAGLQLVKLVKIGILLGIIAQVVVPFDILPIASDPFYLRATGIGLYTLGLFLAMVGRLHLGRNWSDIESPVVAGNHAIVSSGIYRYIRHPIYVGDLALLLGLELCLNSWLVLAVVLLIPVVLRRAVLEEKLLVQRLPGYDSYVRHTKRFIPFVV